MIKYLNYFIQQTGRLSEMKTNISLQGVNVSLLDDGIMTTPFINYTFNATSESSVYYNVTDSVLFILNATEEAEQGELFENYSTSTTSYSTTELPDEDTCFQVMVDCASIVTTTAKTDPPEEELEEEIIDDDEEIIPQRLKRQVIATSTAIPTGRNSTPSITRLLDSLQSILRGLQRNSTRIPVRSSTTAPSTSAPLITTTMADEIIDDSITQPTTELESLDELKRYYTSAQLQVTTTEEEYDDPDLTSVSMSTYEDFNMNFSSSTEPTDDAEINGSDPPPTPEPIQLCPIIVCKSNDTMGHLNNLTSSTTVRPEEESTLPCRGDNPQGCTTYWTSMRETVHSSQYSTQTLGKFKFKIIDSFPANDRFVQ